MKHETAKRFSQNDEQDHILGHFLHEFHGRFLDIGAYDGITFSNTRALLERGWSGIYVEPSPAVLPSLRIAAQGWPVAIVDCAVSDAAGELKWWDCADGVATSNAGHRKRWASQVTYQPCTVKAITPPQLIDLTGTDFNFVNIDVEGCNLDVVQLMPWERLDKCSLVCVEHDRNIPNIKSHLRRFGFVNEVTWNAENLLLSK